MTDMDIMKMVRTQAEESAAVKARLLEDAALMEKVAEVADLLCRTYKDGHKTLWAGNGGSAADAQHMVGELVNKFYFDRPGIPAMALTTNGSLLTAIGNDYAYDKVFSKQIEGCGAAGDVFIGISTSGNSANLVDVLDICKQKGIWTVALVGAKPCRMDAYDYVIHIPSEVTPRIQECQTLIGHILCSVVEEAMFGKDRNL